VDGLAKRGNGTSSEQTAPRRRGLIYIAGMILGAVAIALSLWTWHSSIESAAVLRAEPAPDVKVAEPLQVSLDQRMHFLGQLSAVDTVDVRAQVGGVLENIHFIDGAVVHQGDLLFTIDTTPYQIALSRAQAELEAATAKQILANSEAHRAEALQQASAGSVQNVEQRRSEKQAAQAAVDSAQADVRDARFDFDHCRIVAPFTGRIGSHLVSVGNLVTGSRAGGQSTTLLARLISTDPIHLDFDMSEADFLAFSRKRAERGQDGGDSVEISLGGEKTFHRAGVLDFLDNQINQSSGTIHARATVPNADFLLTPGEFARIRILVSVRRPTLLVPDASVLPDQSKHVVMIVRADGRVVAKDVDVGDLRGGLRVVRAGLSLHDRVVIDGVPYAVPGAEVVAEKGSIRFDASQD
jgi:multidrug efflux system membrane fusion protein